MAENHAHQLKRKSISDQIFDILKEKIISNQWKPGDKIPSETELAASFGVSRLSARTAIQRLSALGLVEIRVGDGTYIKDYPLDNLLTASFQKVSPYGTSLTYPSFIRIHLQYTLKDSFLIH